MMGDMQTVKENNIKHREMSKYPSLNIHNELIIIYLNKNYRC